MAVIPKREEELIRRNLKEPTQKVSMIGAVEIPELGDISFADETHFLVLEMWESIKDSAAVKYYEPTDWAYARLTLFALNQELVAARKNGKPMGAMKMTAINQMLSALLLTEGDRRRVRLEVERDHGGTTEARILDVTDVLRQRLAQAQALSGG